MPRISFKSPRGFTLIELLIAISIIAIVTSIGLVSYSQTQKIARDARRKQDLRSLKISLELFFQKNGHYPCTPTPVVTYIYSTETEGDFWITDTAGGLGCGIPDSGGIRQNATLNTDYISNVPTDPRKGSSGNPWDTSPDSGSTYYRYAYFSGAGCGPGTSYTLVARLENSSDPDNTHSKDYIHCNDTHLDTVATWSDNTFVISSNH